LVGFLLFWEVRAKRREEREERERSPGRREGDKGGSSVIESSLGLSVIERVLSSLGFSSQLSQFSASSSASGDFSQSRGAFSQQEETIRRGIIRRRRRRKERRKEKEKIFF